MWDGNYRYLSFHIAFRLVALTTTVGVIPPDLFPVTEVPVYIMKPTYLRCIQKVSVYNRCRVSLSYAVCVLSIITDLTEKQKHLLVWMQNVIKYLYFLCLVLSGSTMEMNDTTSSNETSTTGRYFKVVHGDCYLTDVCLMPSTGDSKQLQSDSDSVPTVLMTVFLIIY